MRFTIEMIQSVLEARWIVIFGLLSFHTYSLHSSMCPTECICLSQAEIICNTGGLTDIPTFQLPSTAEYLSLSRNNITAIKSETFVRFTKLRKLLLDGNTISKIHRFAFRGLTSLKILSVQYTNLQILEKFSFSALQNVTAILLEHNRIKWIEEYAFAGSSNIRSIRLDNNPIHRIDTKAFSGLRNLENLALPNNIKFIESDAFNGLDTVGFLKLAYMDLKRLNSFTFRGLNHIAVLSIQQSDLGEINNSAFDGLTNVGSLNLLNNKIDKIQEFIIKVEDKVNIVRFVGNHLLQIPKAETIDVKALENFTVVGNHFPCDCRIHSLLGGPFANGTSWDFKKKNFCISPFTVNGKLISDANVDNFITCDEEFYEGNWKISTAKMSRTATYTTAFQIFLIKILLDLIVASL